MEIPVLVLAQTVPASVELPYEQFSGNVSVEAPDTQLARTPGGGYLQVEVADLE